MQFTLDSVTHIESVLKKRFTDENFLTEPFETTNLNSLKESDGRFFFGVLTVGSNVEKATLLDTSKEIIDVVKNSQIIDFFTEVKFFDASNTEITENVKGRFRGFEITIENNLTHTLKRP